MAEHADDTDEMIFYNVVMFGDKIVGVTPEDYDTNLL